MDEEVEELLVYVDFVVPAVDVEVLFAEAELVVVSAASAFLFPLRSRITPMIAGRKYPTYIPAADAPG